MGIPAQNAARLYTAIQGPGLTVDLAFAIPASEKALPCVIIIQGKKLHPHLTCSWCGPHGIYLSFTGDDLRSRPDGAGSVHCGLHTPCTPAMIFFPQERTRLELRPQLRHTPITMGPATHPEWPTVSSKSNLPPPQMLVPRGPTSKFIPFLLHLDRNTTIWHSAYFTDLFYFLSVSIRLRVP